MNICSNPRCGDPKPEDVERCSRCEALLVGALVRNRYKIVKQVGKGGFGITYLIEDQDCFAAKRILKELCPVPFLNRSEEKAKEAGDIAERLFHREAKILLNLSHPGIPKLYAYFSEGDYSYLVQDYIPGQTLSEELSQRKQVFTEREVCELMLELAEILEYLHCQKPPIIHRDIKPQNLMRHSNGRLQLIDFGAVYQAVSARASSETLIGSPGYAPPEQIFGEPVPQSDLYATGATMLRLLTGIHPSKLFNNSTKRMEWETKIKVSSGVAQLLRDLLVVNINKRLRTATELKHRLQSLLESFEQEQARLERALVRAEPEDTGTLHDTPLSLKTAVDPEGEVASRLENSQGAELIYSLVDKVPEEAGTLDQMPFPYLLCRIYRGRLSCRLTCTLGGVSKTIYFDQGSVVFARSNQKDDRLGETLMRLGRLSKEDFDAASELMRTHNLRFGNALIMMGKISQEDLKPLLTEQVREIVYSLFEWGGGSYEVRQEEPRKRSISISLSCADIVFEGLRRMSNIDLVKNWLGDFSWKLSITSDPMLLYQSFNLTPKEGFIVSRIDNQMSVDEILSLGGLPEDETLKTICGLLAVGILQWVDKNRPSYSEPIASVLEAHVQQSSFDIQSAAAFCYEVENMLSTVKTGNHYAVLDLPRSATPEQIRAAYTQLARKFHPDRHAQLAEYNLSLRTDLEKIFARILEAYNVLSDPQKRKEYNNSSKTISVAKFSQPLPQESKEPVFEPAVVAEVSPGKASITQTPSVLDKPVKTQPEVYKTPPGDPASVWFDRGFKYYTSFQFKQACHAFQAAVDSDPNCASYRIFLARSLAQFKGHNARAKEHFCRAIELEPNNPEYLAEVGLFFQKLGMNKEANQMFDRALKIIPDHPIARRAKTEQR